jgi:pSer/pThr/pTyr-binding forkhead associated (FHA) protein
MPPHLVALSEGPNLLLDKPILLVGRHQECDIQISSRKISRKHCCIAQVEDYLVVKDLFSTNGIRINGTRVQEGALKTGDELTIANFRYQVFLHSDHEPSQSAAPPPPAAPQEPSAGKEGRNPLDSFDEPVALSENGHHPLPAQEEVNSPSGEHPASPNPVS